MRLVLTISGIAAVIALAAPAHADDTDGAFLASLDQAGFTYNDPGQVIQAAHYVCSAASGGTAMPDIAKAMTSKAAALTEEKAEKFTAIAASAYCPDAISSTTTTTATASS
ncbi:MULTISPECIES: DUF732 domain-containing protein [unclassified Mycobacterium]|uniref:DUF732 domain-containing protein n=1 Tax=unclassified Mycobacterium TaxID=2642494 RepID=UPI0006DCE9FE|nr:MULTISPECIES: DUF732 domain-containing protein [unclassified Mycobacterium]OBG59390.1 hypothetical protein A5702_06545 [Mycobacterium sp. E3339]OBH91195.1 hypothetical protein A5680_17465 [Mycobacterium sp. E2989]